MFFLKRGVLPALSLAAFLTGIACPALGSENLTVRISGVQGGSGIVQVLIWKDAASFPTKMEKAVARKTVTISGDHGQVTFSSLPRGTYAAAAYQDLNGNGELDRSMLGWPVEPTGASNGARGMMGPPKFSDAAFELKAGGLTVDIRLK